MLENEILPMVKEKRYTVKPSSRCAMDITVNSKQNQMLDT